MDDSLGQNGAAQAGRRILVSMGLLLAVAGCRHPLARVELPEEVPVAFSGGGAEPVQPRWWLAFQDPQLDDMIEQALQGNWTLRSVWDRLAQAEAVAEAATAGRWPQVEARGSAGRSRRDAAGAVTYAQSYLGGVAAGYEVDLWSRLKSQQRAAMLDVQAQREAVTTAAVTLSAMVSSTWYQLAEAKVLIAITEQQIETNRKVLELVQVRYRANAVSAIDVLRQRQLVASTESRLIAAQETAELLQYVLSILVGTPPALGWESASIELVDLPPQPSLGLPSDVLWRRPDVRQVYRRVQAADQRLAVAVAEQYPRLSLSASAETSAASIRDLFDDSLASLAGNVLQPLFDAGLRKAEVRRRRAVVSELVHLWRQTVLEALQEVETALMQERRQAQLLESLQTQLDLARQTYERTRDRYTTGLAEYIRVLESLQSLQSLERDYVRARRVLIERRIDLCRSIAGGWDMASPAPADIDALHQTAVQAGRTGRDG